MRGSVDPLGRRHGATEAERCRSGLFLGGRIQRNLDVRAIGIPWLFFQVFP